MGKHAGENIETHWDTWGNRKTGKKKGRSRKYCKTLEKQGEKRKHRNKWEYRYRGSIGKQGTKTINNILYIRDIL